MPRDAESSEKPILIAGAGIGGLTAAIALARQGFSCRLLECADTIRAEGAGITLQTNAMLVMQRLGVADELRKRGVALLDGRILDRRGRVLQHFDLREPATSLGAAGIALHRRRLLDALVDANEAPVELSAGVTAFEQDEECVTVTLDDGSTREGSLLIGCDGLHSAVRASLRGEEPLVYAGYTTWRGVARGIDCVPGTAEIWGVGERFGIVPIGKGEVYWFAVADAPAGGADGADVLEHLARRFHGWPEGVRDALAHTSAGEIVRTDSYDRDPIDEWGRGRVTLLGDAAHPMTPNLGQGAGQAVEDALALARALDRHRDRMADGLRAYEAVRRGRANRFVTTSRRMGQLAHVKNPIVRALRDAAFRHTPTSVMRSSARRLFTPVVEPTA